MKRTLTVILAVLMMIFAAGCYGNTTPDGATRGRMYGGGMTRGRAYNGAYDGLYRDGNRDGFIVDGTHTTDGAMHGGTTRAHGGAARGGHANRSHGGRHGHTNRAHGNTNRAHGGTTHGTHGGAAHGTHSGATHGNTSRTNDGNQGDGANVRNHQGHRPMVGGLEYLR